MPTARTYGDMKARLSLKDGRMKMIKFAVLVPLLGFLFFAGSLAQAQGWKYERRVDEMTDEVRFFVFARPESSGILAPSSISALCTKEDRYMHVLFKPGGFFVEFEDYAEVVYRIDKQKAITTRWRVFRENSGVGLLREGAVVFLNALKTGKVLKIKLDGKVHTIPLDGSTRAINQLYANCGVADANGKYLW